ncbi:hypothetical protein BDV06DRAFT_202063 [Aspergillus oleicola]
MSLRRKSCNACFRSRRKCNLAYPTCGTCQKTNKPCQYAYPPIRAVVSSNLSSGSRGDLILPDGPVMNFINTIDTSALDYLETGAVLDLFDQYPQYASGTTPSLTLPSMPPDFGSIARLCGSLGEVQPIEGSNTSWQWVIDQLKRFPGEFANDAKTIFIHEQLYRNGMPGSMRTAFGVSSSSCLLTEKNRCALFRAVDDEVTDLLNFREQRTILNDLASLQALALYQTIRFFYGDLKQRAIAEQQQSALFTRALKLVTRSQSEIRDTSDRQIWILAECIRRTAIIIYFLYGVNSIFREGICIGLPTLAKLPLSTELTSWASGVENGESMALGETISYETFLALWLVSTPRKLDPFEKLLLVPCQGLDTVERYNDAAFMA